MASEAVLMMMPAGAEALLLGLSVSVWVSLRRRGVGGVYQLTVAALVVDAAMQGWLLWRKLGEPAGVGWLVHAAWCALALYVLYRLGYLVAQMRVARMRQGPVTECVLVEEGG